VFTDWLAASYGEEALRRMLLGTRGEGTAAKAFEEWTHVPLEIAFQDWAASLAR